MGGGGEGLCNGDFSFLPMPLVSRIKNQSKLLKTYSLVVGVRAPHHNFVVIAPIIMKFGRGVKLDVFYTMVTKKSVTSLLLRHYDVLTCILVDA